MHSAQSSSIYGVEYRDGTSDFVKGVVQMHRKSKIPSVKSNVDACLGERGVNIGIALSSNMRNNHDR